MRSRRKEKKVIFQVRRLCVVCAPHRTSLSLFGGAKSCSAHKAKQERKEVAEREKNLEVKVKRASGRAHTHTHIVRTTRAERFSLSARKGPLVQRGIPTFDRSRSRPTHAHTHLYVSRTADSIPSAARPFTSLSTSRRVRGGTIIYYWKRTGTFSVASFGGWVRRLVQRKRNAFVL